MVGMSLLLIVIGTSIWVFFDARAIGINEGKKKNSGPFTWFIVCLLAWIIFFPLYLFTRRKLLSERKISQPIESVVLKSKKCSYCAEEIQSEALKCKHCGEWLKDKEIPA